MGPHCQQTHAEMNKNCIFLTVSLSLRMLTFGLLGALRVLGEPPKKSAKI